jgi:hypothetical protein
MYFSIVWLLTLPAVETQNERVHKEGRVFNTGNSERKILEVYPLRACMIFEGATSGSALINKCAWSGMTSSAIIS